MPSLKIDMFDSPPSVGDKVQVDGEVKSIDEKAGTVEVSYDKVTNVDETAGGHPSQGMKPADMGNSQSLDQALAKAFPQTQ